MSSFGGRMKEYRFISIDRFWDHGIDKNSESSVFFLSHCHRDHMEGLENPKFLSKLRKRNCRVHCHRVSAHLLLCDRAFSHLAPFLEPHEIDEPFDLQIPSVYFPRVPGQVDTQGQAEYDPDSQEARNPSGQNIVTVTLLPANHCPGSVMFLFEGSEGTALYTGDFRLTLTELKNMPFLHESEGVPKPIDSLYFDSTFCTTDCNRFPSRKKSSDDLVKLAKHLLKDVCLDQHSFHTIDNTARIQDEPNAPFKSRLLLFLTSKYGHEFLIISLAKAFGCKVHVTEEKFRVYQGIPEMKNCVTTDRHSTPLHACAFWDSENEFENEEDIVLLEPRKKRRKGLRNIPSCPLARIHDENVHVIKPSMLWFASLPDLKEAVYYQGHARLHRLLYSTHSSLHEVRKIVEYLKPSVAEPNVVPYNSTKWKVLTLLADVLPSKPQAHPQVTIESSPETIDLETPPADSAKNSCSGSVPQIITYSKPSTSGSDSPP